MNEILKSKLQILANDNLLLSAVRAVFDEAIDLEKPRKNETDNDSLLGAKYRAYEKAIEMINRGFLIIKSNQITKNKSKSFSKER